MTHKNILITGSNGFIGSKLLPFLQGLELNAQGVEMELTDPASVKRALSQRKWDAVIHLAGISHVGICAKDPTQAFRINTEGTGNLLKAILESQPKTRLIMASTAQVYAPPQGDEIEQGVVLNEGRGIRPQNIYAQTKWEAEKLLKDAHDQAGLKVTILRLFNHTHKTQSPDFFLPRLYAEMTHSAEIGSKRTISIGNLDVRRDIGAVHDLLLAFGKLLTLDTQLNDFEVFNICSGTPKLLRDLALGLAKMLNVNVEFVTDPSLVRSGEPKMICGSADKMKQATGWEPHCRSVDMLLRSFVSNDFMPSIEEGL